MRLPWLLSVSESVLDGYICTDSKSSQAFIDNFHIENLSGIWPLGTSCNGTEKLCTGSLIPLPSHMHEAFVISDQQSKALLGVGHWHTQTHIIL